MISRAEAEKLVGVSLRRAARLYGRKLVVEEPMDNEVVFIGSLASAIDLDTLEAEEIGSSPLSWPEWFAYADGVKVRLA